jgi:hypothetical protein
MPEAINCRIGQGTHADSDGDGAQRTTQYNAPRGEGGALQKVPTDGRIYRFF